MSRDTVPLNLMPTRWLNPFLNKLYSTVVHPTHINEDITGLEGYVVRTNYKCFSLAPPPPPPSFLSPLPTNAMMLQLTIFLPNLPLCFRFSLHLPFNMSSWPLCKFLFPPFSPLNTFFPPLSRIPHICKYNGRGVRMGGGFSHNPPTPCVDYVDRYPCTPDDSCKIFAWLSVPKSYTRVLLTSTVQ